MAHSTPTRTDYTARIHSLQSNLSKISRQSRGFSILRFLLFAALVWWIYRFFQAESSWISVVVFIGLIALFLLSIRRHAEVKHRQAICRSLIRINQNELDLAAQKPSFFYNGSSFHTDFSYTQDLDIFGHKSLYHMINRCFSDPGRKMLATWFTDPTFRQEDIKNRQAAVASLVDEVDLMQEFCAQGLVRFEGEESHFAPDEPLMSERTYRYISVMAVMIPVIFLIFLIAAIQSGNNNLILYGFLLNLVLTGLFYKITAQVIRRAGQSLKNLSYFTEPLLTLTRANFQNDLLRTRQQSIVNIHQQLRILQKRYDLMESRANPMVGLLLNGLMGYDFMVMKMLNRWSIAHSHRIAGWLEEIGWFEALFSLGTFARNHPTYTFPEMEQSMGISGSNIRHPFIPDEENIGNNVDFVPPMQVMLLTGSNMSGKSTFLRSVGVNQVLALAGSVVAADAFRTGLYGILTSFRKSDSIQEQTSLFYDELKKLQFIFHTLEQSERPFLVLLDEILRGTNSDDKFFGSRQVLLRLRSQSAMTILATHDIALADLEESHGPAIRNYSFESEIQDGELHFDYKLRKGVAVTKNATFLMKKMGIIPADPI